MKSCSLSPPFAVLFIIIALCTLFTGCTSLQNITPPPVSDTVPTPTGTAPVITATVATGHPIQTQPAGPLRTQASDTEFLLAINASQSKVLNLINPINTELAKDITNGSKSPDYTALGSYARRLITATDEEINVMSKFREISDPANESRKAYYMNYLTRLKPFAANLETGAALAKKKEFKTT